MEFIFGIVVGIIASVVVVALALWWVLRKSVETPIPELPALDGQPAVMVMLIEPFLNRQLREALSTETDEVEHRAYMATQERLPLDLKLVDASLDVQTGRRARFTAELTASALGLKVSVRPITSMYFVPQGGRVKIMITNVEIGGFHVPRVLFDRFANEVVATAEAKMNHSLLQLQQDTGVQLADLETTEDLLILKFAEIKIPSPLPRPALVEGEAIVGGSA